MKGEGSVYFIKENADLANAIMNSYNASLIHFSSRLTRKDRTPQDSPEIAACCVS